jgi:glycerol-3-phosphate acyltransferase PlsY
MTIILWTAVGFLLGSLPLSPWLGYLILHKDIRTYGDGNPGAANVWRAGGWKLGLTAVLLDSVKAAIPVSLANFVFNVAGWGLLPIALAPVLGHSFSPFLGFRGGKAVATTFGTWTGLTLWVGPTLLGIFIALFYSVQKSDTWAVIFGMLSLPVYIAIFDFSSITVTIWICNTILIIWTHRHDLTLVPTLRPWITNSFRRVS